jgi:hypothetical protein
MGRPVSVTVTCWVIIALAIEAIVGLLSGVAEASLKEMLHPLASPISFSATVMSGVVISAVSIALALMMLRGVNWARIAYFTISGILFLCMLAFYSRVPVSILFVSFTKIAVFGTLLFRSSANQYFVPPRSALKSDVAA